MSKKRIVFVCVENSNRSQMAQAFAMFHGGDKIEAFALVLVLRAGSTRKRSRP